MDVTNEMVEAALNTWFDDDGWRRYPEVEKGYRAKMQSVLKAALEAAQQEDMSVEAENVVRNCLYKTKAGEVLQQRKNAIAAGKDVFVTFEYPDGWQLKERCGECGRTMINGSCSSCEKDRAEGEVFVANYGVPK